jgi:hypothetical protein
MLLKIDSLLILRNYTLSSEPLIPSSDHCFSFILKVVSVGVVNWVPHTRINNVGVNWMSHTRIDVEDRGHIYYVN